MSSLRPAARGIVSSSLLASSRSATRASPAAAQRCHQLHSSAQLAARRRPRFSSVLAERLGLMTPQDVKAFAEEKFTPYSPEEKEKLRTRYTPEQMAAIEAGEAAIDPEDITIQARMRDDPYKFDYFDDFSIVQPAIDRRRKTKPPPDPNTRNMDTDEFREDLSDWLQSFVPKDVDLSYLSGARLQEELQKYTPSDLDILKYMMERHPLKGNNSQGFNSFLAPQLPDYIPGVSGLYKKEIDPEDGGRDPEGTYTELKQRMGMTLKELESFTCKIVLQRVVANQTRLGKIRAYSVLAVAGNGNGWLGLGVGKSTEPTTANVKARLSALANMRPIRRYENRTIYGNVEVKISGSVVQLFSRPPGFGLRVPARIFEMCRAAGIDDLSSRFPRSRNPMNTVKAAYHALTHQPDPEEIAIARGKKMVDVRKVYYGGAVH